MQKKIVEFTNLLRKGGVRVSVAESIDAFTAASSLARASSGMPSAFFTWMMVVALRLRRPEVRVSGERVRIVSPGPAAVETYAKRGPISPS